MKIGEQAFTAVDWDSVEPTRHEGGRSFALWRTMTVGDIRIRRVGYSPGYVADHWCDRGHGLFVLEAELMGELRDAVGRCLAAGRAMSSRTSAMPRTARLPLQAPGFSS